jgi:N4-gp56 family major capsid protein
VAALTAKHPLVQQAINRIGLHAAELKDQLIFTVLDAASNAYRPNDRAGDTSLYASDLVTCNDLIELNATLSTQGAKPLDNGNFMFVTPPMVYAGIQRDSDYKASNQLAAPQKLWKGMVDQFGGMDVVKSNSGSFAATSQATAGQTNKVYSSFAFGRGAYQVTDLQSLEVIVTEPGGQGDALKQNYLIGYKFMHKSVISNQNWIRRVRSSGVDAVNN